jgi:hypothetical protein
MAGEIELRLAEFTNGHLTDDQLRDQLTVLLFADFQIPVMYTEPLVEMTSL